MTSTPNPHDEDVPLKGGDSSHSGDRIMPGTISQRLARMIVSMEFDKLPLNVVNTVKLLVLDQIGLQIRGATYHHVEPVLNVARLLASVPQSTVTGANWRTSAPHAAYVNGTLGHSSEFDDAHPLAWHVTSTVVSTAVAFAEGYGCSGRKVITAVVAGSQVMSLLGSVSSQRLLQTGWHGSKVLGTFGATATAGVLLGLTVEQLANAFGIAASDASGTMEYDKSGGEVKRLHAGSAARSGSEAALLARAGFTGPPTIFEGPRGIFAMFGNATDVSVLNFEWERFHILDTIFRLYPAVTHIHSPITATSFLRDDNHIDWHDVERIRIGIAEFAIGHGGSIVRPTDTISAQFSLAFSIGLALVCGHNLAADYFNPALWNDRDILSIADKVEQYALVIDPNNPVFSSNVEIELKDGRAFSHYERGFPGHPTNPATPAQIIAKFRTNIKDIMPDKVAMDLIEISGRLDQIEDITLLASLMGRAIPEAAS